jgi:hypothetical protein
MLRVAQSSMSLACLCLNHLKMSLQALALAQTGGGWIPGGYRKRHILITLLIWFLLHVIQGTNTNLKFKAMKLVGT